MANKIVMPEVRRKHFAELAAGECFLSSAGTVYMKVSSSGVGNCVRMRDGLLCHQADDLVQPVSVTVVVEWIKEEPSNG